MTMTPEQALLREIVDLERSASECDNYYSKFKALMRRAEAALAVLDGEGEEEWTAYRRERGMLTPGPDWAVRDSSGRVICSMLDEPTVRRVARLPKLERAARRVDAADRYLIAAGDGMPHPQSGKGELIAAINDLRAALNDEGTP